MESLTELPILAQGEGWLAVFKPAGLLVHRSALDRREREAALQIVRRQTGRWLYPVHRLDRPTSGALLFADNAEAARELGRQFQEGEVVKSYLAIVRGYAPEHARVDYALRGERKLRARAVRGRKGLVAEADGDDSVPRADGDGSVPEANAAGAALVAGSLRPEVGNDPLPSYPAQTEFERLGTVEIEACVDRFPTTRYSLVRARPITGRLHQIRRHLGHPIVGDVTYGVGKHNRFFAAELKAPGLMLVCERLEFRAPSIGEAVSVSCLPDQRFRDVCAKLNWINLVGT